MAAKIKIDSHLFDRITSVAESVGYANVDDFITHVLEKELARLEEAGDDANVTDRLKGLGYLE